MALVVLLGGLVWVSASVGQALTAPGNDGPAAKLAEWARDHYLGFVVTGLETVQYQLNPPTLGGTPSFAMFPPQADIGPSGASSAPAPSSPQHPSARPSSGASTPAATGRATGHGSGATGALAPLTSPAGANLPGEGVWHVLASVRGVPALQSAYVRPDAVHTSYVAAVASMDPKLLRFELHPGSLDPGPGPWGAPSSITPDARASLVAAFNGGFKIDESGGGFYLNGASKGTLTAGTSSLVFYRDGRVALGVWGRNLSMTGDVVGVRQNLRPLVDHGVVPSSVDANLQSSWGATLGGKAFVWRSGIGSTADGRLIYVYGPALSAPALGDLLVRAGAVQAMELDINPAWTTFMSYSPSGDPRNPTPTKLLADQSQPADRYYGISSRDFVAVYAR